MSLRHQIINTEKVERQRALLGTAKDKVSAAPIGPRDLDLDLSKIKTDNSAQPRVHLNTEKTAEYAEAMKNGDQFPPLVVFHDGETYWLADGFHRHYAAQQAGKKLIRCTVRQGGLREAILYSVGANATHGLDRSDEDKRRAVARLMEDAEWSQWSDREIARRCRVSDKFVAKHRPAASADHPQIARKAQRGGTIFTQKVAKAKSQAKTSEDNGSITGRAGAVAGEASRLASGRTDADGGRDVEATGGAAPVVTNLPETAHEPGAGSQPATSEGSSPRADVSIGVTGGESAAANSNEAPEATIAERIIALWCVAEAEDREAVLAFLRINGAIHNEIHRPADSAGSDGNRSIPRVDARGAGRGRVAAQDIPQSTQAVTNSNQQPTSSPEADRPASTSSPVPAEPFKINPIKLRPKCKNPDHCGGYGRNHCRACLAGDGNHEDTAA